MPKLFTPKQVVKILKKKGFSFISQKGSHAKFRKGSLVTVVPMHRKEVPIGTFKSILFQSGLTEEDFE